MAQAAGQLRLILLMLILVTLVAPKVAVLSVYCLFAVAEEAGIDGTERLASAFLDTS